MAQMRWSVDRYSLFTGLPLFGLLCLLTLCPTPAIAAPVPEQTDSAVTWLGSIGGAIQSVAVSGTIAYIGEGAALTVLDVSQPSQPVQIGRLPLPDLVYDIQLVGTQLHLATGYSGVQILDISTPASPLVVAGFDTAGFAYRTVSEGSLLYIADGRAGVVILDIADLDVVQDTLYLANTEQGIHVIDVTDPEQPATVAALPFRSGAYDVAAKDGYLYATAGTSGLRVFDLTATITPTLIYTYTALLGAYQLEIAEDIAFVASGPGGLIYLFDSSEPAAPLLRSSIPCTGSCRMVVDLPWLYVTSEQGFDITLVSEPYSPRPYGVYAIENTAVRNPGHIMAHGDYVYLPVGVEPFVDVVDVTSPSDPVLYQRLSMNVGSALQTQEYAFLTSGEALRTTTLYPLETVPRLSAKASFVLPNVAQEIVVVENRMYVADGSAGLQILTLGPTKFVPEIYLPLIAR